MMLDIVKDVKVIKAAILKSRYIAARLANGEMLKLYFAIGGYVSQNSRNGRWGSGVIDEISRLLQKELPGLRGFSPSNMKNMRIFYEAWSPTEIRQPVVDKSPLETRPRRKCAYSSYLSARTPAGQAVPSEAGGRFHLSRLNPIGHFVSSETHSRRWQNKVSASRHWQGEQLCIGSSRLRP